MSIAEKKINDPSAGNYRQRINDIEKYLKENVDYTQRFVGHCNAETDIKEAAFLGDDYITAGSDCGNLFIWHRSGRLVFIAKGNISYKKALSRPSLSHIKAASRPSYRAATRPFLSYNYRG